MHSSPDRESVNAAAAVGPQLQRILRERIIRNRLRPGERISEAEIALQFGVSRQPVRRGPFRSSWPRKACWRCGPNAAPSCARSLSPR